MRYKPSINDDAGNLRGQLAVASMLSLKLWRDRNLCDLLNGLEGGRYHSSLGKPGLALLSVVASRLTYYFYAMNGKDQLACSTKKYE